MSDRLQIPDFPQDIPYNLRDWCEAIQVVAVTTFDANNTLSATRCPTLEEMVEAEIPNAEDLPGEFVPTAASAPIPDLPQDIPYALRDWCEAIQGIFIEKTDANRTGDPSRVVLVAEMIASDVTNASNLITAFVPIVKLFGVPDLPQDLPYNLRDWCEAIQSTAIILTDLKSEGTETRCATVQELIDAGVPNAENLLPPDDRPTEPSEPPPEPPPGPFAEVFFVDISRAGDQWATTILLHDDQRAEFGSDEHLVVLESGVPRGFTLPDNTEFFLASASVVLPSGCGTISTPDGYTILTYLQAGTGDSTNLVTSSVSVEVRKDGDSSVVMTVTSTTLCNTAGTLWSFSVP